MAVVQHGGGNVLLWGCVTVSDSGNIAQIEGRTDSNTYPTVSEESGTEKLLVSGTGQGFKVDLKINHELTQETQGEDLGAASIVPCLEQH